MYRIRSCRRLERECHKNTDVLWLLSRLTPDFKTIANLGSKFTADNAPSRVLRRKDLAKELVKLDTRIAGWL